MSEQLLNCPEPLRVLVVDDSDLILQRLVAALKGIDGIGEVREATNLAQGIDLWETWNPDLIMLDIMLPDGDGLQLLEFVKKSPSPPVVVVRTNYPYPLLRKRSAELGAEHFLAKTTELDRLEGIVRDEIEKRGRSLHRDEGDTYGADTYEGDS